MAKRSKPSPSNKPHKKQTRSAPNSAQRPARGSKRGLPKSPTRPGMPPSRASQGPLRDLEADMNAREELLEGSLEQVLSVYDEALDDGIHLPVVFLVDCEDELGGKLARDWVGREEVEEAIEANHAASDRALTTTFAQCLSFRDCQEYVPQMFKYLEGTFQQAPPEGTFVAVVVSCGGAATFFVPLAEE